MIYNTLLENIVLPVGDLFLGTRFMAELKTWRHKIGRMTAAELKQMQKDRLQKLLKHSVTNIPYYRNLNLDLSNEPFSDIKRFPVLYKKIVKEHIDEMYIGDKKNMVIERSSGSSGIQGEVYMSKAESSISQAVQSYIWEWSGFRLGEPLLQAGITPERKGIKRIKDTVLRTQYVNAFNLSHDKIVDSLKKAHEGNVKFFGGYASSLNVFAETAIKEGLDIKLKGVMSWGDKMFDIYKSSIQKAFGNVPVIESYGCTEGIIIAGTCEHGNFHIMSPHVYVELLDKDGNEVRAGEIGYVVVTRLDAYHFPLIRYYLGDLAIKEDEDKMCSCGRKLPMLRKVIGRDTDIVYTPSGKSLIVHFFTGVFEHVPSVYQFRVIQRKKEEVEIEYIPGEAFTDNDLEKVTSMIHTRAEEIFSVKFIKVDHIPSTPSGKPQLVLNMIADKLTK